MNLEKLFDPNSIAVVGVSSEPDKIGSIIASNLLDLGYSGKVFLVNPKYDNLLGRKCYKSLLEIEEEVDLAVIAVPAAVVNDLIKEASQKVENFVVISSGFAETGEEGKQREKELSEIAKANDLNILGPNCLGFINVSKKLNASFAKGMPKPGKAAFISQSGALIAGLMDIAFGKGFGFSKLISIGNKVVIDESALADYLASDNDTEMAVLYLEGIKNGANLVKNFSKLAAKKPVFILRTGQTEKGRKAIASHTAALSRPSKIMKPILNELGVFQINTFNELSNLVQFYESLNDLKNVTVVTNAGGAGVLAAEAYELNNIELARLSSGLKDTLKNALPAESSVENPVDLLGDAETDRYEKVLDILGGSEEIDAVHIILTPQRQTPVDEIAEAIVNFSKSTDKKIFVSFIGEQSVEKARKKIEQAGIISFNFPDEAACTAGKFVRFGESEKKTYAPPKIDEDRKNKADSILSRIDNRKVLNFNESSALLENYDLSGVQGILIEKLRDLADNEKMIEFPCVVKVDNADILHKTDEKALVLGIKNLSELEKAAQELLEKFEGSRLVIQPMVESGLELLVGAVRDETFGPVITVGLGGIYTEQFNLVDYLLPTDDLKRIAEFLKNSKIGFLFDGARGQKPYNSKELAKIISKISALVSENDKISEFDINPLIIYNDGREARLVDVKIILKG